MNSIDYNSRFDSRAEILNRSNWIYAQGELSLNGRKVQNQALFIRNFPLNVMSATFVMWADDQVFESECERHDIY